MKLTLKLTSIAALMSLSMTTAISAKQYDYSVVPNDPALINQERIVYWMKKRGELSPNASDEEVSAKVKKYINTVKPIVDIPAPFGSKSTIKNTQHFHQKNQSTNKTVKVLSLLIDFPDLLHDNHGLSSGDTDMYYPEYPKEHYQALQFSEDGYDGPSNQNLQSGYQYYQAESGGSFFFTGQTFDWVTADNDAEYYGGNDPDDETSRDLNVRDLIKEAIAKAVEEHNIDLEEFDVEDPYDLDGDGNVEEPDGIIDHIMVYHSSIGEETGGGALGSDAIWSKRWVILNDAGNDAWPVPNTDYKAFNFTIQPIDAAAGVVSHEFGHDLGLPDEYDLGNSDLGEPVSYWSIMSSGSYGGNLNGDAPVGFSPYAKDYFQTRYGGNWIDQQEINFDEFSGEQSISIAEAVDHDSTVNQLKIILPQVDGESFGQPYTGDYQYYSGSGDELENTLAFDIEIPSGSEIELSMKARWDIEEDYDYVRVLINDEAIAGNHTKEDNQYYSSISNFITGKSLDITGSEGDLGWLELTFDLTSFAGQSVTVTFEYVTDQNTGGYGFAADDIQLTVDSSQSYFDGAESNADITLDGFSKIQSHELVNNHYFVQLRSHNGVDSSLDLEGYEPGIIIWYANEAYDDNRVDDHPGYGFIGVVDADQNLITRTNVQSQYQKLSRWQVRDAAFSTYSQSSYSGDNHLDPVSIFDDSLDYSSPNQPESGLVLPNNGLKIELTEQAEDSSSATILLSKQTLAATANFSYSVSGTEVSFSDSSTGPNSFTYEWNFGDDSDISTEQNPTHTYAEEGVYTVELTVTDTVTGDVDSTEQSVRVGSLPTAAFSTSISDLDATFTNDSTGGIGELSYSWNFGDGNSSTEENPSHTYSSGGSYTITLTVTDSTGEESSQSTSVTLSDPNAGGGSGGDSGGSSSGGGTLYWMLLGLGALVVRRKNR